MTENRIKVWREVWNRKGKEGQGRKLSLRDLLDMGGYDKGAGRMSETTWMQTVELVKTELDLSDGDALLEIGCGAGAMLLPLSEMNISLAAVDYSASLIEVVKEVLPQVDARVAEAKKIPFPDSFFSKILVHSVFQYFPDYDYARNVLEEILRLLKKDGRAFIVDIPDIEKMSASEATRQKLGSYEWKKGARVDEGDYSHLYYPKKFFRDFCEKQGLDAKILNQGIPQHGLAPFRFNLRWHKK